MIDLKVIDSTEEIAEYTFGLIAASSTAALSFGSTYEVIFKAWKKLYGAADEKLHLPALFPADERLVELENPGSNWGAARKMFIDDCGTEADRGRWPSDAETYRRLLSDHFGDAGLPEFDLILLGIGPDGHTASLFPGGCPAEVDAAWNEAVLETTAPFDPPDRLTLGPEVIAKTRKLVVTVTGAGKADIFCRLLDELGTAVTGETEPGTGRQAPTADLQSQEGDENVSTLTQLLPPVRIIRRREELGLDTQIICDPAAILKYLFTAQNKG